MEDLIAAFLDAKSSGQGRSDRTIQIYRMAMQRLSLFLDHSDPLDATTDMLMTFCGVWLHKTLGLSALGRRTHVAAVREFYRWLQLTGRLKVNPASAVPHPKAGQRMPRVMTLANAERLMWAPDFSTFVGVRDAAMIAVLLGCGLRVSGLCRLNVGHVIEDQIDRKPRLLLKVREKGDRERLLPVPPEADLTLRMYMSHETLQAIDRSLPDGDQVLFVSTVNRMVPAHEYIGEMRRITRWSVHRMVRDYAKTAGIPLDQAHPHALRHLYGTELAEDDVDIAARQQLLGHADPKTTQIYTHLARRKLSREVDRANPLAKMRSPAGDLLKRLKQAP
ncbi:MAG: tyrosine-type recombinase/integrase [Burkholderiales bacterium]|nr:tyrosine-type recombinase/integrase [Burkholderiales bacterium]